MKYKKQGRSKYTKKNHITIQLFNQHSFSKNYAIVKGNDIKQIEAKIN